MNEIKVLWLDDESEEMLSNEDWRAQFEDEGIVLHAEKYAEQFVERLKDNPGAWDLALLDAVGYINEGAGWDKSGLNYAIQQIQKIAYTNNINLPIFIFTGQIKLFDNQEFINSYRDIPIYRKGWEGTEQLIEDIKKLASTREDRAVMDMYPKVFEATKHLDLNEESQEILLGFLKAFHFKEYRNKRPGIAKLRKVLEYLFHSLIRQEVGLIPSECYKQDGNELNLRDIVLYLCGEQTNNEYGKDIKNNAFGVIDIEGPILPYLMAQNLKTIYLYTTVTDSHVMRVNNENFIKEDEWSKLKRACVEYATETGGIYSSYFLVYQLCDIIMYLAAYKNSHSNPVQNRQRVYKLRDDIEAGVSFKITDGILHYGDKCWAEEEKKDSNNQDAKVVVPGFNEGQTLNPRKTKVNIKRVSNGPYRLKVEKK
ncbi:MAG: hypothetical protein J6R30_05080 [Bacteroidales bacterium]|nr:hypothetical protein [Bacteroidales bacterium]